jgi:hypothetical protein
MIMNDKLRRKWSWTYFKDFSNNYLEVLKKTTKDFSQDSLESNHETLKY